MGIKIKHTMLTLLVTISFVTMSEAAWQGPSEIISGTWGSVDDQFGIEHGDTGDFLPGGIRVNRSSNVFLSDSVNKRVKIYKSDGSFLSIIRPQNIEVSFGWPAFMNCDSTNNIYTSNYDKKLQKYNSNGELLWSKDVHVGSIDIQLDDSVIIFGYRLDKKGVEKYIKYSSQGELLQTYTGKPSELGKIKETKLGGGNYKITITYPDKEWGITRDSTSTTYTYIRDINGNLYGVGNTQIVRYNDCGKEIAKLIMPKLKYQPMTVPPEWPENAEPPRAEVLEEYGSPVLAPNGDVYTWKRTPDKYSIVKWTWQDDANAPANAPDAPTNLKATPSTTGLVLSWKASLQDPGCVTSYEIGRSETSGSGYSAIGTVAKGIFKYEDTTVEAGKTYYYKIRAMFGSAYSEYSNEASGSKK